MLALLFADATAGESVGWASIIMATILMIRSIAKDYTDSRERASQREAETERAKIEAGKATKLAEVAARNAVTEATVRIQGDRLDRQADQIAKCNESHNSVASKLALCEEKHVANDKINSELKAANLQLAKDIAVLKSQVQIQSTIPAPAQPIRAPIDPDKPE